MNELIHWQAGLQLRQTAGALEQMNARVRGHGLTLSAKEIQQLALRHRQVLQSTGRVEFGQSMLPALMFAFCDSPHISPDHFAQTLDELMECFYYFKNETQEQVSDDDLLEFMQQHFDGDGQGSVEYLAGTLLEHLAEQLRRGEAGAPHTEEAESTAEDEDAQ